MSASYCVHCGTRDLRPGEWVCCFCAAIARGISIEPADPGGWNPARPADPLTLGPEFEPPLVLTEADRVEDHWLYRRPGLTVLALIVLAWVPIVALGAALILGDPATKTAAVAISVIPIVIAALILLEAREP